MQKERVHFENPDPETIGGQRARRCVHAPDPHTRCHRYNQPPTPGEEARPIVERRSVPFFPNFFAMDLAMWLIALNVVTILATLYPWGLGAPADPLTPTPVGIHPEWYFMSQFQALKVVGRLIPGLTGEIFGMVTFTAVLIFWALIPLFDRESAIGRRARITAWVGYLLLAGMLVFTIWGYAGL